jgi:hypothetical protein
MPVKLLYAVGSTHGVNTWHIRTSTLTAPPAPNIVSVIQTFYTAIKGLFPTNMSAVWDGSLADVSSTEPAVPPAFTPWTVTGTASPANYGPAGVGMVVTWRSGVATRSGRGRTFLSPLASGTFDADGTPLAASLTTLRTAATSLVNSSLADGNGAVSIFSHGTPTAPGKIGRDVQAATVNDKHAWLSSRRG